MKRKTSFIKRYLPTIIAVVIIAAAIIGWSAMWYGIGHYNAVLETTERLTYELTADFEKQMQEYINRYTS